MAHRAEPENMPGSRQLAGAGWNFRRAVVGSAYIASVVWVLVVLPFLAWPYLMTNLALAALQGVLLMRRYNLTIWQRLTMRASTSGRSG
jgi:hypothetical protein